MDLMRSIASSPVWLSVLLIVIVPTILTMCGPVIVRRFVGMEKIVGNNEVAGFKFATLGVIYAVLLGLVVISVWEKYSEADDAVTRESGALASLYRLAGGVASEDQQKLRASLAEYADSVAQDDWPAMAEGDASEDLHACWARSMTPFLHSALRRPATPCSWTPCSHRPISSPMRGVNVSHWQRASFRRRSGSSCSSALP